MKQTKVKPENKTLRKNTTDKVLPVLANNKSEEIVGRKTKKGDFEIKLNSSESFFIEGCFFMRVISTNALVSVGGVIIDSKFYNDRIPIYSFAEFPKFEVKLFENSSISFAGFAELEFTPIKKMESNLYSPFVNPSPPSPIRFLKKTDNQFLNLESYHSVCLQLQNRFSFDKNIKEVSILIYGEKNCGKSSLANFMLNFLVNKSQTYEVQFIDLDVGKPIFDSIGFVSKRLVETPFFINAVNSLICGDDSTGKVLEFVGENSPQLNPSLYLQKIKLILETKLSTGSNKQVKVNLINHLGFCKGQGKLLLQNIKSMLPGNLFKIKIDSEAVITIREHSQSPSIKIPLQELNYHIRNPHFFQERRLSLVSSFLFENKNIVRFGTSNVSFKVISVTGVDYFYKKLNSSLLQLIFASSVVDVSFLDYQGTKKSYLGLFLGFEQNNEFITVNLPFCCFGRMNEIPFMEITKSSYLDFGIEKCAINSELDKDETLLPFMGVKAVGVGSKVLRKKVSKRR